tara:strand:+ start:449 stop:703 length:255 start_codon:yes stop_codon:yes gene_type:complete
MLEEDYYYQSCESKYPYNSKESKNLVMEMRAECLIPSESTKEFMAEFAKRCYKWDKSFIRTFSEEAFISDLITINYLKIIKHEH